ncbi:MAG: DUF971 domain-containing protein [Chloroflexi bacterium]|nr:DUF971 domain-containing protein [Chloroflexota bacterium]
MSLRPVKVEGSEEGLAITWSDGHQSFYPGPYLRGSCRCAECMDEWSSKRIVTPDLVEQGVYPVGGDVMGQYAIRLTWSDGHTTGIYSYDYLRSLCPCNQCQAEYAEHR